MALDSRSMAEHNFGTLYSLLIIFCFTKFVSGNSLKMKAKFLVEKSQYQWFFPLSRRKDPTDSCQTGFSWNICGFEMADSEPPAGQTPWGCTPSISPYTPAEPGEVGMMGVPWLSSPGVRAHLGHPGQSVSSVQCQFLVALTPPVLSSFPLSSCTSDTSWLLLATEDQDSSSRSSGWLSGSPFSCPEDNHPKMMEPCSFASYSETALRKG